VVRSVRHRAFVGDGNGGVTRQRCTFVVPDQKKTGSERAPLAAMRRVQVQG
jgi:hypothetical protein